MSPYSILCVIAVAALSIHGASGQYSLFETCAVGDPNFKICVTNAAQKAILSLVNGAPQLGLPPIDPLPLPSLPTEGRTLGVNLGFELKNALLKGLSRAVVEAAEVDPDRYRLVFKCRVDGPVDITGAYSVEGRAMMIPFSGDGTARILLNNVEVILDIQGHPVQRNGDSYMNVDNAAVKLSVGDLNAQMDNLFGGYRPIGDAVNAYANEHWREILPDMLPSIERSVGLYAKQLAAQVFDNIPYGKIFPRAQYFYNIRPSRFGLY